MIYMHLKCVLIVAGMYHLSKGYDDEEGGYNVNYMSATLFHDSNGVIKKGEEG